MTLAQPLRRVRKSCFATTFPTPAAAGEYWHVFAETSDFDSVWALVPRPGIVVTEGEIKEDPVLRPRFDDWRAADDSAYRRFMEHVLDWTEDEDDPN